MATESQCDDVKLFNSVYFIRKSLERCNSELKQHPHPGLNMAIKKNILRNLCIIEQIVKEMKGLLECDFAFEDYEESMKRHNAEGSFSKTVMLKRNKGE